MINFKEITSPEEWELFARDFFVEQEFYIESNPDRGPDGGKDMLISEDLRGNLNSYRFRWLVSCKHFAESGRSVGEAEEQNILDRVKTFKADGFIGFYSTLSSAALNTRLNRLREENNIKDFRIMDYRSIEAYLMRIGYSNILHRYFPGSFKEIKPLQLVFTEYEPIICHSCGKDLLLSLYERDYSANVIMAYKIKGGKRFVNDVFCVCKGECDKSIEAKLFREGYSTGWQDLSDLIIPANYLFYIMALINNIREGKYIFSNSSFEKEKVIILALSQKVLRHTTQREKSRVLDLMKLDLY